LAPEIEETPVITAAIKVVEDTGSDQDKMLFGDLLQSIGYAESWRELDGWLTRASQAHRKGALSARQLEALVAQAIEVSRTIPEN
jgi:hypothetical protein